MADYKTYEYSVADRFTAVLERLLSWPPEKVNSGWEDILVVEGLAHWSGTNQAARSWVEQWFEHHREPAATDDTGNPVSWRRTGQEFRGQFLTSYCGNWGLPLAAAAYARATGGDRYTDPATRVCDHILANAVRGPEGAILHRAWTPEVWVDTLYYSAAVLARGYELTQNNDYLEEAVTQCRAHTKLLRDGSTGLYFHEWDPRSGRRTANFWSRGNGWIMMSYAEVLDVLPSDHPDYGELVEDFRRLVSALLRLQQSRGLWRIVPEEPDSSLETSGSAMNLVALARGIQSGVLQRYVLAEVERGLRELSTYVIMSEGWDINATKGCLMGSQHPAGVGGWDILKLAAVGEDAYTSGVALKLFALAHELGLV